MSSDGGSFTHYSFHVGADWLVRCSTYADRTPILSVDAGPAVLTLMAAGGTAGDAAVEFARALAREAAKFAEETERMHAARLTGDGKAADTDAA